MIIDGIKGAHSEYHWLPPNCERSCHIISSSLGVDGLPPGCPRDAEDAHTAIFVFFVVVFAVVLIVVVFDVVIRGRQAPPQPRFPKMKTTLPPPGGGGQDHAGVDGGYEALDPPPRASGPAWWHRILSILNTIFVVVVSVIIVLLLLPSSAVGALSPYSHRFVRRRRGEGRIVETTTSSLFSSFNDNQGGSSLTSLSQRQGG